MKIATSLDESAREEYNSKTLAQFLHTLRPEKKIILQIHIKNNKKLKAPNQSCSSKHVLK